MQGGETHMHQIVPYGDNGLIIQFGNSITPEMNQMVRQTKLLLDAKPPGVIEFIPSYNAITVIYDPSTISFMNLKEFVKNKMVGNPNYIHANTKVIDIPVCYGSEFGPDLTFVAEYNSLSTQDVITLHANHNYLIYMIGFTPGFPYLGGMSKRIAAPRLQNPRNKIPSGSVGIAGEQTGIYPQETPGGWRIIGRTPLKIFDFNKNKPMLFEMGDFIRFIPVNQNEYTLIENDVQNGNYKPTIREFS